MKDKCHPKKSPPCNKEYELKFIKSKNANCCIKKKTKSNSNNRTYPKKRLQTQNKLKKKI